MDLKHEPHTQLHQHRTHCSPWPCSHSLETCCVSVIGHQRPPAALWVSLECQGGDPRRHLCRSLWGRPQAPRPIPLHSIRRGVIRDPGPLCARHAEAGLGPGWRVHPVQWYVFSLLCHHWLKVGLPPPHQVSWAAQVGVKWRAFQSVAWSQQHRRDSRVQAERAAAPLCP